MDPLDREGGGGTPLPSASANLAAPAAAGRLAAGDDSKHGSADRSNHRSIRDAIPNFVSRWIYGLALAISISTWFVALRAPLWLDETISYFLIKGRFSQIMPRQGWPEVPIYYDLLWLWTKLAGATEIALRFSSLLPLLAAVYLLYRAACELFDFDVAMIGAIVFVLHPIVTFAAIDVRPYAFVALATCAAILVLLRLRDNNSNWLAAWFGILTALIANFHFLMVVIVPALAIAFVAVRLDDPRQMLRQGAIALAAFVVAFLPVVPGLLFMFRTSNDHVFASRPGFGELIGTIAPGWLSMIAAVTLLAALAARKLNLRGTHEARTLLICASLGFVPILLLYGISAATPIHIFVPRYHLIALPGIALFWAFILSRVNSSILRLLFCVAFVAGFAYHDFTSPDAKHHSYSWKYALQIAEKNASADDAPVLVCSYLPESDHMPIPVGDAVKDSALFAPLSYYTLSVPVVGLPRTRTPEAMRLGSLFVQQEAERQQRFLALGHTASYDTLHWLEKIASRNYDSHLLGQPDGVMVLEFQPRNQPADQH